MAQNESTLFNELDSIPVSASFDNDKFNKTIHEADAKIIALKEDSIRIVKTKELREDGKKYIPKCVENNQLYLDELTLLERVCQSKRINAKVLKSLKFRFVKIYISSEKGAGHQLRFPDADSVISDYKYINIDTLCLANPIELSDYPALSQSIEKGLFVVIIDAKNQVMPMPVDYMPEEKLEDVSPEDRTAAYYEERAAMLGVRIKNVLSKAKYNYPEQSIPSYDQYLDNESKKKLDEKGLASYRQSALEFLTSKYGD